MRPDALTLSIALVLVLIASPASADVQNASHSLMYEKTNSYIGIKGQWTDPSVSDIPCPQQNGQSAGVMSFVTITANDSPRYWMQFGFMKSKEKVAGACGTPDLDYVYEYWSAELGAVGLLVHSYASPPGSHDFSINRVTNSNCRPGADWCWTFRFDGSTSTGANKYCCDSTVTPSLEYGIWEAVHFECFEFKQTVDYPYSCEASGLINPVDSLQFKKRSDGQWYDWSGKDDICVDYDYGMRGLFLTLDTEVKGGWNQGTAGQNKPLCSN